VFRIIRFLRWCGRWRWRRWLVIVSSIDEGNGSRCHFKFDDLQESRAAEQREMIDKSEISELSKSRSRFSQVPRSSRRSAILDPATSKKHWLGLQSSELSVEWYKKNSRTLKNQSGFPRIKDWNWGFKKSIAFNQYSFFVAVCYRLLICAFADQCWFTSTVMIRSKSVYCMCVVYWLNWVRGFDSIYCVLYM
jgi:hypothetical protein